MHRNNEIPAVKLIIDTAINEVYKVRKVAENTQVIKPAGTDVTITIDTPSVADSDKEDTTVQKPEELFGDDDYDFDEIQKITYGKKDIYIKEKQ